jgi:DNA-directed RNA polymerase subunit RPC12/RpoP
VNYKTNFTKEVFEMPEAYCVKCRKKVEMKNPEKVTLRNGKPAMKGVCPNCGTKVFKIGG